MLCQVKVPNTSSFSLLPPVLPVVDLGGGVAEGGDPGAQEARGDVAVVEIITS